MYTNFSVQVPKRFKPICPQCQCCEYLNVYNAGYGAQRKQCYCEHPNAEFVYKKYDLKGDLAFICFSKKMSATPAIKTSPRWCPLRSQNMFTLSGFTDGYCRAGKRVNNVVSGARMDAESEEDT